MKNLTRNLAAIAAAVAVVFGLVAPALVSAATGPVDTDANAIMWGGAYDKTTWQNKVKNGDGHNSASNLQTIYYNQGRGISASNFNSTVDGVVYKDGHVTVGGKTVATGAKSLGRQNMPGSTLDHGLYIRPTSVSFASTSIQAFVNMDGGVFHYAILKSCGNPVAATPVPKATPAPTPRATATPRPSSTPRPSVTPSPSVQCLKLTPSRPDASGQPTLFRFTATPAGNGAVTGYRFTFDDGTDAVETDADTPYVERTVSSGSLKVHAEVKDENGNYHASGACVATATVTAPHNTPTPKPSATPTPTGQVLGVTLPDTGPETVLGGALGLSAIGVAGQAYLRSRKSVLQALRGKIIRK